MAQLKQSVSTFVAMGTINTIVLYEKNDTALMEIYQYIQDLEQRLTVHIRENREESEISRINRYAGNKPVVVSEETYKLVDIAKQASLLGKEFNVAIGPLTALWRHAAKHGRIPQKEDISTALCLINAENIQLDPLNKSVFLLKSGMSLDLGAIAKGYAADHIKQQLIQYQIKQGMIDLGGNIVLLGKAPNETGLWRVGIQKPFAVKGEYIGILHTPALSIVTSGSYERYMKQGNKQYHHIISSRTGYPIETDIVSSTIISERSVDGEIFSTITFAMFANQACQFLQNHPERLAIIITKHNEIFISQSLMPFFILKDNNYQIIPF